MTIRNDAAGFGKRDGLADLLGGAVAYHAGDGLLSGRPIEVAPIVAEPDPSWRAFVRYFGGTTNALIIAALGTSFGAGIAAGVVAFAQMR